MRTVIISWLLFMVVACDSALYGTGMVYAYNGTNKSAEISLDGRTPTALSLRSGGGQLVVNLVAGPYQVTIKQPGTFPQILATEFVRDRLTLVNVDGAACFARADILGMYSQQKAPVKLSQIYRNELISSIREEISVLPGEHVPDARPRSAEVYLRADVIPCDLAGDDFKVEDYLNRHR